MKYLDYVHCKIWIQLLFTKILKKFNNKLQAKKNTDFQNAKIFFISREIGYIITSG